MMHARHSRLWGLTLAAALLLGCQASPLPPTGTPFGVAVTDGAAPSAPLPGSLTGNMTIKAGSFVPNQLIVRLEDGIDPVEAFQGYRVLRTFRFSHQYACLEVPAGMSLEQAHEALLASGKVTQVALNWIRKPLAAYTAPTTDAYHDTQWALRESGTTAYWKTGATLDASKVIVAVLDTGLDVGHPEFADRVVAARNFCSEENPAAPVPVSEDVTDLVGHGTHVAGIIGAAGNNGQGMAGLAWDVQIMPVKVLGEGGSSDAAVLAGMDFAMNGYLEANGGPYAGEARTRVINLSLGMTYHGTLPAYEDAFARAREKGIMVVVAAGNDSGPVANPANQEHILSVSSTSAYQIGNQTWEWLSGFSNRGDRIDLAAPGGQIMSTLPRDGSRMGALYGLASGTSMASPFVAGAAALVIAKHDPDHQKGNATFYDQVKQHLMATADDLGAPGKDPLYGVGRVNVFKALSAETLLAL